MTSLILIAALQAVISVEAGLVNHVEGEVNVPVNENVPEGTPIRTGAGGYAEILLNPGSFLRLGAHSEAILEGAELTDIRVRLVDGVAILEAAEIPEEFPITVLTGNLRTSVIKDGIYKFGDGRATVLEGELGVADLDLAWEKGWTIYFDRVYRAARAGSDAPETNVERWSRTRAALLAEANNRVYRSLLSTRNVVYPASLAEYWIWMPNVGSWAFFPMGRYQSPYGYRYRSSADLYRYLAQGRTRAGSTSGIGNPRPPSTPGTPSTDSGSGGAGAPAPRAPAYSDIVPGKNGPGTQQPN